MKTMPSKKERKKKREKKKKKKENNECLPSYHTTTMATPNPAFAYRKGSFHTVHRPCNTMTGSTDWA
jgi:hypothetical protein